MQGAPLTLTLGEILLQAFSSAERGGRYLSVLLLHLQTLLDASWWEGMNTVFSMES